MKCFTNCSLAVREREGEGLRNIVRVHVLQRGRAVIGKNEAITSGEQFEYTSVEIPRRIDRHPSRSRDVTGVKHRRGKAFGCGVQEETLDLSFANSVFAERLARR